METLSLARFVFAFAFVLGLIWLFSVIMKRYAGKHALLGVKQEGARLEVLETRYLDAKRKLLLIRCDAREHLLLLGEGHETVIESNPAVPPERGKV